MTPDVVQGHWQRVWLQAPGVMDTDTRVHWMQCGARFADIRVPARRPDVRGAKCLADLSARTLRQLATAEGFAGTIALDGDVCTWHRAINWHGASTSIDAGKLAFDGEHTLIEDGVHADYSEKWQKAPGQAQSALDLESNVLRATLVTVGARFVFGIGDPHALNSSTALKALEAGSKTASVAALFGSVYAFGAWVDGRGTAVLCTNPLLEGREILRCGGADILYEDSDFFGQARRISLRHAVSAADDAA